MEKKKSQLTNKGIDQIIAERDFYKKILDKIPAVIHVNNLNTKMVAWVNDTAEKMSGYKKNEIVNNPDFLTSKIIDDDLVWITESILDYKKDEEVYSYIYSLKHADGSIANYHGIGVVFDYDEHGKPLHNLAVDINITHEIRNYKQLKRQYEDLTIKLNQHKINNLTKTEIAVIKVLCNGKTLKEIAHEFDRSPHTIDKHIRKIFLKLDIHKTSQLTLWAKEVGLV